MKKWLSKLWLAWGAATKKTLSLSVMISSRSSWERTKIDGIYSNSSKNRYLLINSQLGSSARQGASNTTAWRTFLRKESPLTSSRMSQALKSFFWRSMGSRESRISKCPISHLTVVRAKPSRTTLKIPLTMRYPPLASKRWLKRTYRSINGSVTRDAWSLILP